MTPTSELIAYLADPPDGGNRYWGSEYSRARAAEAAALISSLVAERDAGAETALRIAGKYADAVDRVEALTNRALNAERLLAEARAGLRDLLRGEYESAEPGLCDCVDNHGKPYQSQFLADRIAAAEAALSLDTNKGDGV